MKLINNEQRNLKVIKSIRKRLENYSVTRLADALNYSRQNLYKHLDEQRAHKANITQLLRISDKLDSLIADDEKKANKIIEETK